MAYTFKQMYDLHQTLWDKSGSPYLPEEQFDELANVKYNDFVTAECAKIEQGQEHTVRIHELYRKFQKANSNQILRDTDLPNFRYLLRFKSKYKKTCNGVDTFPEPSVRKASNNSVDIMQADPFNKGIDADPCYVLTVDANNKPIYQVLADTVPLELNGTYVRTPQKIDSKNNPNSNFELSDFVAEAIVRAVVFRSDVMIENLNRAQAEAGEQQELNSQ